ncbi:MAG: hypothetical protein AAFR56_19710 [Chloroflexota bacterium]
MLRLILRPLLLLTTVLVLCVAAIRSGAQLLVVDSDIDRFTTAGCASICWMGLEIGHTTDTELTTLVRDDTSRIPPHLMPAHNAYVAISNNERRNIGLTYSEGVMFALRLTYDDCPGGVIGQAGVPDEVYIQPGRSVLLYYGHGLTIDYDMRSERFHVDVQNPDISIVNIRRNPVYQQTWPDALHALRMLC